MGFLSKILTTIIILVSTVQGLLQREDASLEDFSYSVTISAYQNGLQTIFCNGALISSNAVLTVASCIQGASQLELGFGSVSQNDHTLQLTITKIVRHPDFNTETLENNLAVLILPISLTLSNDLASIDLPYPDSVVYLNDKVHATSYAEGEDNYNAKLSDLLGFSNALIYSRRSCAADYEYVEKKYNKTIEKAICVRGNDGNGISCGDWDLGAPLNRDGTLIGLLSFTVKGGCAEELLPGAPDFPYKTLADGFIQISPYTKWIQSIVADASV